MVKRLGEVIYWEFCGLAAMCFFLFAPIGLSQAGANLLGALNVALAFIGGVSSWIIGRACLYVLSGR
jgi:hypothetical protein